MKMYRTTSQGDVLLTNEETAEILEEREAANQPKQKTRTLEERIIELEQRVAKLEK